MQLELSRLVESDLDYIANYIAQDNPRRAVTFIRDIRATFHDMPQPLLYQLRPDMGGEAHMTTVGSYAILFRIAAMSYESSVWYTAALGPAEIFGR